MNRIAYLACAGTLPGSPERRGDAFEHDMMEAEMIEPYLYPEQGLHVAERLAAAVQKRLT